MRNGCMMGVISTDLASQTAISTYGANTVPNPSCGGAPLNDVWFTAVVPASGKLTFDMDDYQMNDAALAVYRRTGTCPTPTFAQVAGACFFGGSTNAGAGNMPRGTVTGLTPGETVYIRVWREAGSAGNAYLCIQDPDPPPVTSFDCYLTLRMNDTGGNGWNGSRVTINNLTAGTGPVDYTILSGSGFINIPVGHTDNILVSYTAVGGFQNEISFTIVNQNNSLVFSSANPPVAGINWNGDVSCAAAVVPIGDCAGAYRFCSAESINYSDAMNPGLVNDLAPALNNRGCMSSGERAGAWFKLTPNGTGTLAFTITPGGSADYDFAVWGPNYGGSICPPPGPPIRCSWAAGSGPTGLSASAADNTEGAGGDRWVSHITNVQEGEYYWFYVDNYSMNGVTFSFSLQGTAPISCNIAPVDLIDFNAHALQREVEVYWATSAERASSHFIVERSADGATFEPIGRVNAQGDAVGRTEYKFWDRAPLNGINYYRLRQVDKDDSEALSQAVAVMFQNGAAVLQVFPNPATDVLSTSVGTAVEGDIAWRVLDASGRIALEGTTKRVLHGGLIEMPISPLDGGSYLLELRTDDGSSLGYARFVKQ
ncbi:MAG: T9SS type A sorting domain-containing protein [Flavobacteriales bacterium]|nr:T9SS type A sorting domain-containing protein [Flavobacteriales bacterium]